MLTVFINDRSDIHAPCVTLPKGHSENPTDRGISLSWLEWTRRDLDNHGAAFRRGDVVLINAPNGKQYTVNFDSDGNLRWHHGDLDLRVFLTPEQTAEAEAIAERCRALAKEYPVEMRCLGIRNVR